MTIESKPQVIAGTAGVVHKNPSKTPTVVADTSVKEHLYGWGGTRNKVLGSKDGSTDSIGDKDKNPKTKGTKTETKFIPP